MEDKFKKYTQHVLSNWPDYIEFKNAEMALKAVELLSKIFATIDRDARESCAEIAENKFGKFVSNGRNALDIAKAIRMTIVKNNT